MMQNQVIPSRNKGLTSVQQTLLLDLVFMHKATGQLFSSQLPTNCEAWDLRGWWWPQITSH